MTPIRVIFQICLVLIVVGALNWGLVGLSPENDLILTIFPGQSLIRSTLYILISIAGIVAMYLWLSYPTEINL